MDKHPLVSEVEAASAAADSLAKVPLWALSELGYAKHVVACRDLLEWLRELHILAVAEATRRGLTVAEDASGAWPDRDSQHEGTSMPG